MNKTSLEETRAKVERRHWLRPWIQLTSFFSWLLLIDLNLYHQQMKEPRCSKFITVTQVSLGKARNRSPKDKRIHARMIVLHGNNFLQLIMWEFWPALSGKPLKETMVNYWDEIPFILLIGRMSHLDSKNSKIKRKEKTLNSTVGMWKQRYLQIGSHLCFSVCVTFLSTATK